jgi:hypothetical protein
MKRLILFILSALGALAAPSFSRAANPTSVIKERYPDASHQAVHVDEKNSDWIYRVTPSGGESFYVAYGRARAKSGYYYILLTATSDGKLLSVELPSYPFPHGRKAVTQAFLKQFIGRASNELSYGREIHGVTGATSTGKSTTIKVRHMLAQIEKITPPDRD